MENEVLPIRLCCRMPKNDHHHQLYENAWCSNEFNHQDCHVLISKALPCLGKDSATIMAAGLSSNDVSH